jgi:Protein of unknown function (DUF1553)/Protein of unknown function (DUF1549)
MIRTPLAAALAVGFLWGSSAPANAEDTPAAGISPQAQKINELIAKGYENAPKGGVKKPADKATDSEFLRRSFIDLIGRIPTPEEVLDFEADHSANKRAKLVYRLLNESKYIPKDPRTGKPVTAILGLKKFPIDYNDAFAENFGELWTTWMLTRTNTNALYRTQFESWLADKFSKDVPWDKIVQDVISATGKTNDNGAVVFVLRHLGDPIAAEMGAKPNFDKEGKFDAVPITSRVTRLFLGIKTQCVQCHDHPFNKEYLQADFWGVNAFFRQTDRSGTTNPNPRNLGQGITPPQLTLSDVGTWNRPGLVLYERRDGQRKASYPVMLKNIEQAKNFEMSSKRLVSGEFPMGMEGKSRRQVLAQWVIEHDNFGKAFVNRMWGHLFGRGLNKEPSVDDFSMNNEVVHPELLEYLSEEFKKYNYNPKKLLEWICTSDVYQLSHVANKAYADQIYDPYFARMPLKALSPEVMFDSLAVATRAETRTKDKAAYDKLKADWSAKLTQNFGDDEGNEINFNGTVVQALLMMNGKELNDVVGSGKGKEKGTLIADIVARHSNPQGIYDELFLMTVSRHPTKEEIARLEDVRNGKAWIDVGSGAPPTTSKGPPPKTGVKPKPTTGEKVPVPGAAPNDPAFYQDVFWALLNSSEFMLNH